MLILHFFLQTVKMLYFTPIVSTCDSVTHFSNPLDNTTLYRRLAKPPPFSSMNWTFFKTFNEGPQQGVTYEMNIFLYNTLDLVFSGTFEQMKLEYQRFNSDFQSLCLKPFLLARPLRTSQLVQEQECCLVLLKQQLSFLQPGYFHQFRRFQNIKKN